MTLERESDIIIVSMMNERRSFIMDQLSSASLALHLENKGKLSITTLVPLKDKHDLSLAYTTGVASPCQ